MGRLLTIGMAVYSDFNGLWATLEGIRVSNPDLKSKIEFIVVDNDPLTTDGERTRNYIQNEFNDSHGWKGSYVSVLPRKSTSLRNLIFHAADTPYVLCLDSHVFLTENALVKTIKFIEAGLAGSDLFHGPLYSGNGFIVATHMNPAFRGGNFGTWGILRGQDGSDAFDPNGQPMEIPAHGMGLFLCERDSWLGFHHAFRHFGGEEGYIQEKYRQAGRKVYLLPFLGWVHRFGHSKVNYTNTNIDKLRNHLIGFREIGLPERMPLDYYSNLMLQGVSGEARVKLGEEIKQTIMDVRRIIPEKPNVVNPFIGFPMRINDYCAMDSEDYSAHERILPTKN